MSRMNENDRASLSDIMYSHQIVTLYHGHRRIHLCLCPSIVGALTQPNPSAPLSLLRSGPLPEQHFLSRQFARAREEFHVLENAQMTPSNVPNTAMLTGMARTRVGTIPRQKTRPPDSAYISCAVRHDDDDDDVHTSAPAPTCKRVLRTSKGNVAIQPRTPAAAPATSGAHGRENASTATISP